MERKNGMGRLGAAAILGALASAGGALTQGIGRITQVDGSEARPITGLESMQSGYKSGNGGKRGLGKKNHRKAMKLRRIKAHKARG